MKKLLLGMALSVCTSAAMADDGPAYKAPPATVVSASGWYLSVDGARQSVSMPDYGLGFRKLSPFPYTDAGLFQTFKQRIEGSMIRGLVGYFLPSAFSDTLFGDNTRVEIGGLYGRASGRDTGIAVYTGAGVAIQTLDGAGLNNGYICSLGQICTTNTNLSTEYSNWELDGKIAGDYSIGAILVTPSLAVFGGNTRANQMLAQTVKISISPALASYDAITSLRWTDIGARAGVDVKVDVTPRVALSLGGWAGFSRRQATLGGADSAVDSILGLLDGAGAISTGANATSFVANAEAGLTFKWLPNLTVHGFAGLNYDSKVPGIASSSFSGGLFGITSRTPAGISFHSETSYYAGGGLSWAF